MNSVAYYLSCTLPFIAGAAILSFGFGLFLGWLFWSHYPAKTHAVEMQNDTLRNELRRLTALATLPCLTFPITSTNNSLSSGTCSQELFSCWGCCTQV